MDKTVTNKSITLLSTIVSVLLINNTVAVIFVILAELDARFIRSDRLCTAIMVCYEAAHPSKPQASRLCKAKQNCQTA
jgi:hypothetical protein